MEGVNADADFFADAEVFSNAEIFANAEIFDDGLDIGKLSSSASSNMSSQRFAGSFKKGRVGCD